MRVLVSKGSVVGQAGGRNHAKICGGSRGWDSELNGTGQPQGRSAWFEDGSNERRSSSMAFSNRARWEGLKRQ
jgi:hypothetical protein